MWNLDFTPPQVISARVLTRLPDAFQKPRRTEWGDANKPGEAIASFLEGPSFDRAGNLYVTDIPFGRIFRISPKLEWTLVAEYDGWPNGIAIHRDGTLWIADYRRGLLQARPLREEARDDPGTSQQRIVPRPQRPHVRRGGQLLLHRPGADRPARSHGTRLSLAHDRAARARGRRHPEPQRRRAERARPRALRRGHAREPGVARAAARRRHGLEGRGVAHLLRHERTRRHGGGRGQSAGGGAREPRRRVRAATRAAR